jgi:hypothetical protein
MERDHHADPHPAARRRDREVKQPGSTGYRRTNSNMNGGGAGTFCIVRAPANHDTVNIRRRNITAQTWTHPADSRAKTMDPDLDEHGERNRSVLPCTNRLRNSFQ